MAGLSLEQAQQGCAAHPKNQGHARVGEERPAQCGGRCQQRHSEEQNEKPKQLGIELVEPECVCRVVEKGKQKRPHDVVLKLPGGGKVAGGDSHGESEPQRNPQRTAQALPG